MIFSPLLSKLIDELQFLPGIGPKTAQRLAFNMLQKNQDAAYKLAGTILTALDEVKKCIYCQILTENSVCSICSHHNRDKSLLCIVSSAADVLAIEQTGNYSGVYFVLGGHLSPIDGIGPDELGLSTLNYTLQRSDPAIKEVILATATTLEGETTAHYLSNMVSKFKIACSRIAYGVPLGGELEYIDAGTLTRALKYRALVDS